MSDLVRYDEMCRPIDAAYEVDEVKAVRDKAKAMEHYFRLAKNPEPERQACEIRLRAERKAGELARAMERAQGRRSDWATSVAWDTKSPTLQQQLDQHGISKGQARNWQ